MNKVQVGTMTRPVNHYDLIIVDALNIMHRSHNKLRHLTREDGLTTGALYGSIRILFKMLKTYQCSHMIVAFDSIKNDRKDKSSDYKSNRPSKTNELRHQIEAFRLFCKLTGIASVTQTGWEADDVIAAIALKSDAEKILILSNDHDFEQLVSERIHLCKNNEIINQDHIKEMYGVDPYKIADIMAIMGDPTDNVKGVPKWGKVKSTKIIKEHGDYQSAINNNPVLKEYEDTIINNYELVNLHKDYKLNFNDDDFLVRINENLKNDHNPIKDFCLEWGMASIAKQMNIEL